ncbi:unnamed protein product [Echinostoma caproni]|uniref:Ig-like domain-containing protein n=1 Tax=Echinostoma caproni TaxID=27848 RepID=A0A183B107_9TREM|nr:unnamed protein product [Echinostoma caproni]
MDEYRPTDRRKIVSWDNYLDHGRLKTIHMMKERDKSQKMQRIHTVVVEPNPVRIPGVFTARCPSMSSSLAGDYTPNAITWIRTPSISDLQNGNREEIIHYSTKSRMIKALSKRDGLDERSYIYPPQKWSDSHTLDVIGLVPEDYGFYICVTTFLSGSGSHSTLNITKRSDNPLCIMPPVKSPKLTVSSLLTDNSTGEGIGVCHPPNVTLLLKCDATAFRLFCEKADQDANGVRLIETSLAAYIHLITSGRQRYVLEITTPIIRIRPLQLPGSVEQTTVEKFWSLPLKQEYDGAYLTCRAKPSVTQTPPDGVKFLNWLNDQFDEVRQGHLVTRSRPVRICVSSKESVIRIDPIPNRWVSDKKIGVIELIPNQVMTCTIYNSGMLKLELMIFPILSGKSKLALSTGLHGIEMWLDKDEYPVQWKTYSEANRIRLLVPNGEIISTEHMVICIAKPVGLNQVSRPCRYDILELIFRSRFNNG